MREVLTAAERRDEWTTAEIASAVDLSARQVRDHLHRLVDDGVVSCEYDGSGYVWRDDGLHRVNENGAVELEPVDDDELGGDESAEMARMCSYTWDFRGHARSDAKETTPATTAGEDTARTRPDGGTTTANPPD
jgi:DNA-binding transcriptional ArsR family regulator